MVKTIEGEIYHEIEVLGNKKFAHLGFRDKEDKFGDMLSSIVPEIGMRKKVRLSIEVLEDEINLDSFINKNNIFVVVGVSKNKDKYGFKVFKDLKDKGYNVYGINPKLKDSEKERIYTSLELLPVKADVLIFVVKPEVTENVLKIAKKLKISKIWLQPGSESEKSIKFCKDNNLKLIANQCVMIKSLR